MNSTPPSISRNRLLYVTAAVLVIGLGLFWRSGILPLPYFVSKYGGDALWALVVFFCFGFLFPRRSTLRVALIALAFAWSVEFLQLYQPDRLERIRATLPGRLILGRTFNAPDLLAYALGIAVGAIGEFFYFRKKTY